MIKKRKQIIDKWPILILISAFAPYISPTSGIKGDNLVIYAIALLSLVVVLTRQKLEINRKLSVLFLLWVFVFVFLIVTTSQSKGYMSTYSFLAEIKNFSQPLAIMFIFLVLFYCKKKDEIELIIKNISLVLIVLLSLNTLWILLGLNIDLSNINQYFVRRVALNAAGNSRFTGVFNQPMEAGIAYSIGLFSWIYLVSKKIIDIKIKYVFALVLLLVGGSLSVSKIFIFGGIGIFIINLLMRKRTFLASRKVFIGLPVVLPIFIYYLADKWQGVSYLSRLFNIENYRQYGFLYFITAGRFGEGTSQQNNLFQSVWESSPLFGQGMGSQMVYDSAFFHFFSSGGIIALSIYIMILLSLMLSSWSFFSVKSCREEAVLFFNNFIIIILSSFGSPVLTVNRASVIIWVYICLIYWYLNKRKNAF